MARCLELEDYTVDTANDRCVVTLDAWEQEAAETFGQLLQAAFPGCNFSLRSGRSQGGFLGFHQTLTLSGKMPPAGQEAVLNFLKLVSKCLTIEDALDESHALAYHQDENESTGNLTRSALGRLVISAKYGRSKSDRERIGNAVSEFIRSHPRYNKAQYIASVPSHSGGSGLPGRLVKQVRDILGKEVVKLHRTQQRLEQKEITDEDRRTGVKKRIQNQRGSMRIDTNLTSDSIVILDDLYGSGATMQEAARACRAAGADEVLGLYMTKQRLYGGVRMETRS